MKTLLPILSVLFVIGFPSIAKGQAAPVSLGDPDVNFGADGFVQSTNTSGNDIATDAVVDGNNRVVSVGHIEDNSGDFNGVIARVTSDGSLDTTFGTDYNSDGEPDGFTVFDFGSPLDMVFGMADYRELYYAACGATRSAVSGSIDISVALFNNTGALETAFGSNGILNIDVGTDLGNPAVVPVASEDIAAECAFDDNGNLFVTGKANDQVVVLKVDLTGSYIPAFGANGIMIPTTYGNAMGIANTITIDQNGMLLLGGRHKDHYFISRHDPTSGAIDTTYQSPDGYYMAQAPTANTAEIYGIAEDAATGFIMAVGYADPSNQNKILVVFSKPQGVSHDTLISFPSSGDDRAYDVVQDASGNFIVAGYTSPDGHKDFALIRYTPDLLIDTNFGDSGFSAINVGPGSDDDQAFGITTDNNGQIVLAGVTNTPPDENIVVARVYNKLTDDDGDTFFAEGQDCDDSNDDRFPDNTEECGDGIDQDCDGVDESCDPEADPDPEDEDDGDDDTAGDLEILSPDFPDIDPTTGSTPEEDTSTSADAPEDGSSSGDADSLSGPTGCGCDFTSQSNRSLNGFLLGFLGLSLFFWLNLRFFRARKLARVKARQPESRSSK